MERSFGTPIYGDAVNKIGDTSNVQQSEEESSEAEEGNETTQK